jgi:hypothetical protein
MQSVAKAVHFLFALPLLFFTFGNLERYNYGTKLTVKQVTPYLFRTVTALLCMTISL